MEPKTEAQRKPRIRMSELLHVIRLRRRHLYLFSGLSILGALLGQIAYTPLFTAQSQVKVVGQPEIIQKYVDYLKSPRFFLSLAETLKLRPEYSRLNLNSQIELPVFRREFWEHLYLKKNGNRTAREIQPYGVDPALIPLEQLAGMITGMISVNHDGARIIRIRAATHDPYTSMVIANAAAETAEEFDAAERSKKSELGKVDGDIETTRQKMRENEKLIAVYGNQLAEKRNSPSDDDAEDFVQDLENLKRQRALMITGGYDESHARVLEVDGQIQAVTARMRDREDGGLETPEETRKIEELKASNKLLAARTATLEKDRLEVFRQLKALPREQQQLTGMNFKVRLDRHSRLPAAAPRPTLSSRLGLALVAGLLFGCCFVLMLEVVDRTVKGPEDLEKAELVVLGTLPRVETAMPRALGDDGFRTDLLICHTRPDSPEAMAFRPVTDQIAAMHPVAGKPGHVIVITSADRAEGKSFTATNLAIALSQLDRRVLFLDCDIRNPSAYKYFGYESQEGLTDLLTMKAPLPDLLVSGDFPNLDILPAGSAHPDPTELVGGDKFRMLIRHLKTDYDHIVIDAPAALLKKDAPLMAGCADAIILVASYRRTSKDDLILVHRKILKTSRKRVHAVLNNVDEAGRFTVRKVADGKPDLEKFAEHLGKKSA